MILWIRRLDLDTLNNLQTLFQATIFVGIALLVSNGITLMVADKMPRRLMLIFSSLGISLSLIAMGVQVSNTPYLELGTIKVLKLTIKLGGGESVELGRFCRQFFRAGPVDRIQRTE